MVGTQLDHADCAGYNNVMKKNLAIIALLTCPPLAMAGNFAECLLDELPAVQNNNAAGAAYQVCSARFPERYAGVAHGSGQGFFGYESGAECALKKARDTQSQTAAGMIRVACNRLYDKPIGLFDDLEPARSDARVSCEQSTPGPWCEYR